METGKHVFGYLFIYFLGNGTPKLAGTKIFYSNRQTETGTKTVFVTLN